MEQKVQQNTRIKLIYNSISGANRESPDKLMEIIKSLQLLHYTPEVFVIEKGCDISGILKDALGRGIRVFAACGGDGTISAVAKGLAGTDASLCIIPSGTQNNIAFSLGIPNDIPAAVASLQIGTPTKIDLATIACGNSFSYFLEVCSVGLLSAVFPACDDMQHGDLSKIGDFLAQLVNNPACEFHLVLDQNREVTVKGHLLLISNMPYVMRHFAIGGVDALRDSLLDILVFADVPKLGIMKFGITGPTAKTAGDPRIQHFRARFADIETEPAVPVMADGCMLSESSRIHVEVQKLALTVMLPKSAEKETKTSGELNEKQ